MPFLILPFSNLWRGGDWVLLLHPSIPNQPGFSCLGSLHTLSNARMAEPQFRTLLLDTGI